AVTVKPRLPEVMADDGNEIVSPAIFVIGENAAHQRLHAQRFKILARDQSYAHLLRFSRSILEADVLAPHIVYRHFVEGTILRGEVAQIQRRWAQHCALLGGEDSDQAVRIRK